MIDWNEITRRAEGLNPAPSRRVELSRAEWQSSLSEEVFRVTREAGTERPFSSDMCAVFEPGRYSCACCKEPLFDATQKFDSGTGWPSFTQPATDTAVAYHLDNSLGRSRVETTCAVCDAHLGHVFPDGPPPTGLRYCINALALLRQG